MHKLTDNPGLFEEIQRQITSMFSDLAFNNFVMSNSVEMIFELVSYPYPYLRRPLDA